MLKCENPTQIKVKVGTEGELKTAVFKGQRLAELEETHTITLKDVLYISEDNRLFIHQFNESEGEYSLFEIEESELTDPESIYSIAFLFHLWKSYAKQI